MPRTPTTTYSRDAFTIGELAQQWRRDPSFIKQLIAHEDLHTDDIGLIPRQSVRAYVQTHGHPAPQ